jgi:outer membrane protein OmpA-like peptidoglycan-associated protein
MIICRHAFCKNYFHALLIVFAGLFLAHPSIAQNEQLLKPFPNSTLVTSTTTASAVYQVPLGILQRQGNRAAPEKSVRVNGSVTKLLYEISDSFNGAYIRDFFQQQFESAGFERLFACEGRSCGSSNDWANDVFGNRVLYGPAENQFFMTYLDRSSGRDNYVVSYIITRGNGRLYAYMELVETAGGSSDINTLSESLLRNKFTVLANVRFADDELTSEAGSLLELVSVLKLNPELELYIVAHLAGSGSLERLQARSQKRADSVATALIAAGIDPARLVTKGVGPLAPGCNGDACRNRVEVVLH